MTDPSRGYVRTPVLRFTVLRSRHAGMWSASVADGTVEPDGYSGPFYDRPNHPQAREEAESLNSTLGIVDRRHDPWRPFAWVGDRWVDVADRFQTDQQYGECPT